MHIGHDTVIGQNVLMAAGVGVAGVVRIEDDVILWGQVGVSKDLTIGKGAVVLAQLAEGDKNAGRRERLILAALVKESERKMKELAFINQLPGIINELKHPIDNNK